MWGWGFLSDALQCTAAGYGGEALGNVKHLDSIFLIQWESSRWFPKATSPYETNQAKLNHKTKQQSKSKYCSKMEQLM